MRILVTGITGFIGSHLTNKLLERSNCKVIGMARDKNKTKGLESRDVEIRYADLKKPDSLEGITKDIDVVVHLAALMHFHASWDELYPLNVVGTELIVKDSLKQGVKHFIYSSSTEAIGPVETIPGDERALYNPTYLYGKTKQLSEIWLNKKKEEVGLPVTIVRPTGVFGPGDLYVGLSVVKAIAQRKLKMIPGKGDSYIHFTYIDDVVQGFLHVIDAPKKSIGETFNIASNDYHTYKEIFTTVANILDIPPPTRSAPMWLANVYLAYAEMRNRMKNVNDFVMHTSLIKDMKTNRAYSNEKAKKILGFKPEYNFQQGMKKTIKWYKENNLI
jgi:dihydroflavonol-4-reductase